MVDGVLFGFLGHGLQLVEQDLRIEPPRDLGAKLFNSGGDYLVFWLLEKLSQRPDLVKPFGVNLSLFAVIGRDDVVHGLDVTAGADPDCLA